MSRSQFELFGTRRFLPFFITQALAAFNDNVYKQALILAILFRLGVEGDKSLLVNLCALLFILPFFLFSALGGQLGERYPKDRLIRALKLFEVLIVIVGAAGLLLASLPVMLAVLFLMGLQAALFGPVKYSILPQHLKEEELVGGNALVEMGTFLAILFGTITAGVLLGSEHYAGLVAGAVLVIALLAYASSQFIPAADASSPTLPIDWNPLRQTRSILRLGLVEQHKSVSRSLLGNAWFWFLGAVYLTQIPAYAKDYLHGDESAVTLILTVFSIGIATGSALCERLSRRRVEMGLVPLGAIGLTLFGVLLWAFTGNLPAPTQPYAWTSLLGIWEVWGALVCILGLGVSGGIYIVPLYALIQTRTPSHQRTRAIAANNILNALFMVVSAVLSIIVLTVLGFSVPVLFLLASLLNVAVNTYLFRSVPEFVDRFKARLLERSGSKASSAQ
jgi:MFS family permease